MTNTAAAPTTRSAAVKVAEDVSLDELAALFDENRGVTILLPRSPRRLASVDGHAIVDLDGGVRRVAIAYEYCDRNGYTVETGLTVGHSTRRADVDPVFDFYNAGRVVRLAAEEG